MCTLIDLVILFLGIYQREITRQMERHMTEGIQYRLVYNGKTLGNSFNVCQLRISLIKIVYACSKKYYNN